MRIIAGNLGGRHFQSPKGHKTHPMSDKVRGALFNSLGNIQGLTLLDAFSGSGAISFEAISRGADAALAVESDRNAINAIKSNIDLLGLASTVKLIPTNLSTWIQNNPDVNFDLVIADPPYNKVQDTILEKLQRYLKPKGIMVVSLPPEYEIRLSEVDVIDRKKYGDSSLVFYRRSG